MKNTLRITAGSLKGRRVEVPPGIIRPVMESMREALFSILLSVCSEMHSYAGEGRGAQLQGCSFLDMFSGSGIVALEAFSRGAYPVHAVEQDRAKYRVLKKNLSMSEGSCTFSAMSAEAFLRKHRKKADSVYNIVFVDPPFPYRYKREILEQVLDSKLVQDGTRVCIHYPSTDDLPNRFDSSQRYMDEEQCKAFGQSLLSIYKVHIYKVHNL